MRISDWSSDVCSSDLFADALSDLMASGRLPRAGFALLQALDAALRRDGPLNDGSPGRERGAVLGLVNCLGAGAGFAGGPRLAARLARRLDRKSTRLNSSH